MPTDLNSVTLLQGYRFKIEFGEDAAAYASEVSGFDAEYDVAEYRAGDDQLFTTHKYPGLAKYSNITIKQCLMSDDMVLYNTVGEFLEGKAEHRDETEDVTITLMDDGGEAAATWTLSHAWVVKYTGPDLNSTSSDILVETIELAHQGLKRTK